MGRKKTPESDARATKERIIETAESLFRDVGYAKTTVADIAGRLGMSPANIYRYFPTKAHINEEICDRLVRGIESRCAVSTSQESTIREQISRFVLAYHRALKESILKENRLHDMISIAMEQHWPVIQSHSERIRNTLLTMIEQGVAAGEFSDMGKHKMARAIHESIAIFIYPPLLERWVNEFSDAEQEDSVEWQLMFLINVICNGMSIQAISNSSDYI